MPTDKFFLVPQITATEKYIDISRDGMERELNDENGEFIHEWEESLEDDVHQEHVDTLRLNISCRSSLVVGWTIALKMHGVRIDGIDWHGSFTDPQGNKQQGWHRHSFSQTTHSADRQRHPISALEGVTTRTQFLIRTLKEMKILVSGVDHGNYELFEH